MFISISYKLYDIFTTNIMILTSKSNFKNSKKLSVPRKRERHIQSNFDSYT